MLFQSIFFCSPLQLCFCKFSALPNVIFLFDRIVLLAGSFLNFVNYIFSAKIDYPLPLLTLTVILKLCFQLSVGCIQHLQASLADELVLHPRNSFKSFYFHKTLSPFSTSLLTTTPAPIQESLPILTPGHIEALIPVFTL